MTQEPLAPDYPHEFDPDDGYLPSYRIHDEIKRSRKSRWPLFVGTILGTIAAFALVLKWSLT